MMSQGVANTPVKVDTGVYYRRDDYAGVGRRLLVDVIDFALALTVSGALTSASYATFYHHTTQLKLALLFSWIGVWFSYFVLLKRSVRTAGYWIGRVRIVNLQGNRPGILALTFRLMFAVFGPFNVIIDLLWIGNDSSRQALRDKFARTYVIRRFAEPAGTGDIKYTFYDIIGVGLLLPEVSKPEPAQRKAKLAAAPPA